MKGSARLTLKLPFILLMASHCGSGTVTESGPLAKGSVVVSLPAFLQTPLSEISLEISGAGMTTVTNRISPVSFDSGNPNRVTLAADVPVGTDRVVKVEALTNGNNGEGFRGEATVAVTASGISVPIELEFLNFALDDPADILDVSGVFTEPEIGEFHVLPVTLSTEQRVILNVEFEQTVTVGSSGVFIGFDEDFNEATGSQSALEAHRGGLGFSTVLGIEHYLEVMPNQSEPTRPFVNLFNGDTTPFSGATMSLLHADWDQTLHVLSIDFERGFFTQFVGDDGRLIVIAGETETQNGVINATDSIVDEGAVQYDIPSIFTP